MQKPAVHTNMQKPTVQIELGKSNFHLLRSNSLHTNNKIKSYFDNNDPINFKRVLGDINSIDKNERIIVDSIEIKDFNDIKTQSEIENNIIFSFGPIVQNSNSNNLLIPKKLEVISELSSFQSNSIEIKKPENSKKQNKNTFPTFNNQDMLLRIYSKFKETLISGTKFLKYGRRDLFTPSEKKIVFSDDLNYFYWVNTKTTKNCLGLKKKNDKNSKIPCKKFKIDDILDLKDERNTNNFKRFKNEDPEKIKKCFSIILKDRSIDLEAFNIKEKERFLKALSKIIILRQKMKLCKTLGLN